MAFYIRGLQSTIKGFTMYLNKVFYKGGEYMRQWTSATGVCIHAEKRERSNYENTYCDRSSQRNCLR